MEFISQPTAAFRLGNFLIDNFARDWTHFRGAVAFVKRSGTRHIRTGLAAFSARSSAELIVGIDHKGTTTEGLRELLDATAFPGRVLVVHNRLRFTFHPKVYLFKSATRAEAVVGSGNLTEGGLFTNYEAGIKLSLDRSVTADAAILGSIEAALDAWADERSGVTKVLDSALLERLVDLGLVIPEAVAAANNNGASGTPSSGATDEIASIFGAVVSPGAPQVPNLSGAATAQAGSQTSTGSGAQPSQQPVSLGQTFVMTLKNTDVGVGQTTRGTQRRSPEIFIPLAARDANPSFWDWPRGFTPDPNWAGKLDRNGRGKMDRHVRLRMNGATTPVTIWYNPDKKDIRIRSEIIRSAGSIDDILLMQKAAAGSSYDYDVSIVQQGTPQYPATIARCTQRPPNSPKLFGYY
ncbi:hypothetical protein FJW08_20525 [Mesorhizobium sp. B3-2-1]|uniref:phospholipase D family protein n=1 Tax=Mesorhizobium sp. B3-2-1 TaxID=2589891 RepID=UPI001127420D|nr:phospholipase D family protein [Mesorhizobium sp. B3-2-1]TPI28464.1 hypothetical protein FJW08_20525 [Mesorhizobium sp. B3-2-1]